MSAANPFEEEIEADYHKALLETGNLPNMLRGSHKWTGRDCWLAEGFMAKVSLMDCKCGKVTPNLLGFFRLESNAARNASRLVAIREGETFPPKRDDGSPHPVEIAYLDVLACGHCIDRYGFASIETIQNLPND
jgi:hypothetical protein